MALIDKQKIKHPDTGLEEKATLREYEKNGQRYEKLDYFLIDKLHDQHAHQWIEKNLDTGETTEGFHVIPNEQSSSNRPSGSS